MKYDPFIPPITKELDVLSKRELRAYFDWFISQIPGRVHQLESAVRSSRRHANWEADLRPGSLKEFGEWFCESVEDRKLTRTELREQSSGVVPAEFLPKCTLTGLTLSLCIDAGVYLGEVLRARHKHLFWHQFLKGKTWVDYGQPVLVEFTLGPLNPISFAMNVAYEALDRTPDTRAFWKHYLVWSRDATLGVRD